MNIEDYREYCLSLGEDVEEKLPFTAFHHASGVLVFYVHGHMFSFFDCDDFSIITLKCQPERIQELAVTLVDTPNMKKITEHDALLEYTQLYMIYLCLFLYYY